MSDTLPESKQIKTLFQYDTVYSADSVEWCPHEPNQHIFVCANYQLTENEESDSSDAPKPRVGRILLFSILKDKGLILHQTIDTAAILDQKWCHCKINGSSILAVANAKKSIEIYQLNTERIELEIVTSLTLTDDEKETLILSLDWSTGKYESDGPRILCSDSKGNIHMFLLDNNNLILENTVHSHEFEAWITAFYYWDTNIYFSGGDDCLFLKYDKRTGNVPTTKNRSHQAGVTSMHSNCEKEYIFATGSYDEHVRIWDIRNFKSCLNEIKMPGPLWRLKWDPFKHDYLLAACMLGGVHVISAKNETMEVIESYYNHKNIAYGADWCYLKDVSDFKHDGNHIIGSCSFYDHLLCISKLKIDNI